MTIDELYEKLQNPDFQDTATGQLFFPAYMYLYNVEREAEIERRLRGIKEGLQRPSHYLDSLILDIFEELVAFLKNASYAGTTKWAFCTSVEEDHPKRWRSPSGTTRTVRLSSNTSMPKSSNTSMLQAPMQ